MENQDSTQTQTLEDVEAISEDKNFSGFPDVLEITNAFASGSSTSPSVAVDTRQGIIDQLSKADLRTQNELEEPLANSTLLEKADEAAGTATVGETDDSVGTAAVGLAETEAGEEGSKPSVKSERKRIKRRRGRNQRALNKSLSKLPTKPNGQGNQDPEAEPSNTQPSGIVVPPTGKRGKDSPGEVSESKRPRREESHPVQPSYVEAAGNALVISIVPLISEGNEIRATAGDKQFIVEKLEQFIASSNPNINITDFSLRGNILRLRCLNQKTLECVKSVVCPLKGPRGNLKGYQCLSPGDRPPLVTYGVWVEKPVPKKTQLFAIFQDANNWINPKKMAMKAVIPREKGTTFLIGVDPEMRAELERRNFQLHYGVGRTAHFKTKPKGQQTRVSEAT